MDKVLLGDRLVWNEEIYRLIHHAWDETGTDCYVLRSEQDLSEIRTVSKRVLEEEMIRLAEDEPYLAKEGMYTDLGTVRLESKRLIYRAFCLADAERIYTNWMSDAETLKYMDMPIHADLRQTERVLERYLNRSGKDCYLWAITKKDEPNNPIGYIHAKRQLDKPRSVSLQICIGKTWWHQKYGTEAVQKILEFLFMRVGVFRVEAGYDTYNKYAGALFRCCGFRSEGVGINVARNAKKLCHVRTYAILKSEYMMQNVPLEIVEDCPCPNKGCQYRGNCASCRLFHIDYSRIPQSYCVRFHKKKKDGLQMEAPL